MSGKDSWLSRVRSGHESGAQFTDPISDTRNNREWAGGRQERKKEPLNNARVYFMPEHFQYSAILKTQNPLFWTCSLLSKSVHFSIWLAYLDLLAFLSNSGTHFWAEQPLNNGFAPRSKLKRDGSGGGGGGASKLCFVRAKSRAFWTLTEFYVASEDRGTIIVSARSPFVSATNLVVVSSPLYFPGWTPCWM